MSRRGGGYKHCVPRSWALEQYPFADDPHKGMVRMWCGGESRLWDRDKPFDSPRLATCIKCAQAIGKHGLGKRADRLRLEPRAVALGYDKSTYDVYLDGTLRAHVGIANGWGEKWYLAKVGDMESAVNRGYTNGRHGGQVSGSVSDYFTAMDRKADSGDVFWPVHYTARDAMACAALAYWDKHGVQGLPTVDEARAQEQERREAQAVEARAREARAVERQRERDIEEGERLERVATWQAGLEALEARPDLSNVERAGLEAIKVLYRLA